MKNVRRLAIPLAIALGVVTIVTFTLLEASTELGPAKAIDLAAWQVPTVTDREPLARETARHWLMPHD